MLEPIKNMNEAFDFKGKNVIVTGGNKGIGFGISTAFAQSGANVAIFCRDIAAAEEAVKELARYGGKYESFSCDVTSPASIREAVSKMCGSFGQIDVLVNNAGVACGGAFLDMDEDLGEWYRVFATDLNGVAHMTYEVGKRMRDAGKGGAIVNISSNAGFIVNRGVAFAPYSTSKAAVNHFTRCMAVELGEHGIRVNAIAPGFTFSNFSKGMPQETIDRFTSVMSVKRFGEPIEIGALAVYLASPAAAQVTGTVQVHDGGYMLTC
ncbi:MAG: SDR family oxidoreductase [Peptococcaceae bacterium]|jgi:NAD(P)-dependent dehydrogenase (short-subunit alcohol dehydrogenase family)|nr:SDR family oxidoreductase [Peptococcaceae bacterium]